MFSAFGCRLWSWALVQSLGLIKQGSAFRIWGLGLGVKCEHDTAERIVPILCARRPGQPPDSLYGKKDVPELLADLQLLCFATVGPSHKDLS